MPIDPRLLGQASWLALVAEPALLFLIGRPFSAFCFILAGRMTSHSYVFDVILACGMLEIAILGTLVAEGLAAIFVKNGRPSGFLGHLGIMGANIAGCYLFWTTPAALVTRAVLVTLPLMIPMAWISFRKSIYLAGLFWKTPQRNSPDNLPSRIIPWSRFCAMALLTVLILLMHITLPLGVFHFSPTDGFLLVQSVIPWAFLIGFAGSYQARHIRALRTLPLSRHRLTIRTVLPSFGTAFLLCSTTSLLLWSQDRQEYLPQLISLSLFALAVGLAIAAQYMWQPTGSGIAILAMAFFLQFFMFGRLRVGMELHFRPMVVSASAAVLALGSLAALYWTIGNSSRPYQIRPGNSRWIRR